MPILAYFDADLRYELCLSQSEPGAQTLRLEGPYIGVSTLWKRIWGNTSGVLYKRALTVGRANFGQNPRILSVWSLT